MVDQCYDNITKNVYIGNSLGSGTMSSKSANIYKKFAEISYKEDEEIERKGNEETDRKRVKNFLKNLNNDTSYHAKLLKKLSDDDLAYFFSYVKKAADEEEKKTKPSIQRQWYNSLNNFSFSHEFDLRVLDVDCKFCTCIEDLKGLEKKQKECDLPLNEQVCLEFYKRREKYGNPTNFKYRMIFSRYIDMPFIENGHYTSLLLKYLKDLKVQEDQKEFYQFHLIDIFLMLIEYSFLEFIKKLEIFFDRNLFHLYYNNEDLLKLIKKLRSHTLKFKTELNQKLNEDNKELLNIKTVVSYISGYYHLKNINTYHDEITDILVKDSDIDERCQFMPPEITAEIKLNSIRIKDLLKYCGENKPIDNKKFNNDMKLVSEYKSNVGLLGLPKTIFVPAPSISIDLDTLMDFKVFYREIIINCFECYNNSKKYDTKVNISTVNILKRSNDLIDIYKNQCKAEYDSDNYKIDMNQKNNILYKHTILLTEKIRKGFYREYRMMNKYEEISILKKDIRSLMNDLYSITDPHFQANFFAEFYKGVVDMMNEFAKAILAKK